MTVKKLIYFGFNDFKKQKRGVENVILTQVSSFDNSADQIFYIYVDEKFRVHKYFNVVCIELPNNILRFIFLNVLLLKIKKKYFKKSDFFFIHSHNYLLSFFSFFKTFIFTVHDALAYSKKCENSKFELIWKIIEKNVYRRSTKVQFISNYSLQEAVIDKKKYNGKVVTIYNTTPLERNSAYSSPALKKTSFEILIVRSIEKRANIDMIIELAQLGKMEGHNFKISIIGKGPFLEHYQQLIALNNLDNIRMLGYLPDEELKNYYNKCDLVVVPCIYGEGFGLPVIEGYLFNKPVLASNVCALPEIIIDKRFLFQNDANKLLSMILKIIKSPPTFNYKHFYNHHFSKAVIENKYRSLYNSF